MRSCVQGSVYLDAGERGVLVGLHHSIVGLHVHQAYQEVLPAAALQDMQHVSVPCVSKGHPVRFVIRVDLIVSFRWISTLYNVDGSTELFLP